MKTPPPDSIAYKIYPTLLDAFTAYLKWDVSYDRYYSQSDTPAYTPEEWEAKQFLALIDRINRVPFDSEAADKGTAFNELVDALVEGRRPNGMEVERSEDDRQYVVRYNGREFIFPISLCREFADYYKGALTQQRVEAVLPTAYGNVLLYGVIDELMPTSVHDIKTTGSYTVGKFKDHMQHLVYPYCLMQGGSDIRLFEYNVTDFRQTYTESYTFRPERDIPSLTNRVEEFIRFIEENRILIKDKKIFGGEKDE